MGSRQSLAVDGGQAGSVRLQFGALCWQPSPQGLDVLLITSRDTGRWIIPKGWPMLGLAPEAVAAQEAWEEAGVEGDISATLAGRYGYHKAVSADLRVACAVSVYSLHVRRFADSFPEAGQRRRQWFSQTDAAGLVDEPDLALLIARFSPPPTGRRPPIGEGA